MTQPRPLPPGYPQATSNTNVIQWLQQLSGRQFEEVIGAAYQRLGYIVIDTGRGADGGVDLILVRGNERTFVQCKNWKAWSVGVRQVRELKGVVVTEGAAGGIVVTSGRFTKAAVDFGRQAGVVLVDGPQVVRLVGPVAQAPLHPQVARSLQPLQPVPRFTPSTRPPAAVGVRRNRPSPFARFFLALGLSIGAAVLVMMATSLFGTALVANLRRPASLTPASFSTTAGSPGSTTAPASLGEQPMDIAIDPKAKRLYTANFVSGNVSVLDENTLQVVDTIDVPGQPVAIAVDPKSHRIFVADRAGKRVYVLDTRSHKKVATMRSGKGVADLAFDSRHHRLFVANSDAKTIWAYDTRTNRRVGSIRAFGEPRSMAVDANDGLLYVVSMYNVFTYRTSTLASTGTPRIAMSAKGIAVDPNRQRLYLVLSSSLQEQNLLTGKSELLNLDGDAIALCIDPSTRTAYLADPDGNVIRQLHLK